MYLVNLYDVKKIFNLDIDLNTLIYNVNGLTPTIYSIDSKCYCKYKYKYKKKKSQRVCLRWYSIKNKWKMNKSKLYQGKISLSDIISN